MVMPTDLIPLLPSTMDEAMKIPIFGIAHIPEP